MPSEPADQTLVFLRQLDARMGGLFEDVADLRRRMTTLAQQVATSASPFANLSLGLDTMGDRLDRIERRLDLVDIA